MGALLVDTTNSELLTNILCDFKVNSELAKQTNTIEVIDSGDEDVEGEDIAQAVRDNKILGACTPVAYILAKVGLGQLLKVISSGQEIICSKRSSDDRLTSGLHWERPRGR
jgi:hypothetical protein